jgi:chemotaxis signal transduction protein
MVMMPEIVAVPNMPNYVRGVINLRGHVFPLIDLRMRCGMESLATHLEQLCALLEQREQDHKNWLTELEKSVTERRNFTLATDPHKCAFGKWYDSFHTDDLLLAAMLKKFDAPHKAIHSIAHHVENRKQAGDFDGARTLIENARKRDLFDLVNLFGTARTHIRSSTREIAIAIETDRSTYALAVDAVESAEALDMTATDEFEANSIVKTADLVSGIAKRKKDQKIVMLLDIGEIFG